MCKAPFHGSFATSFPVRRFCRLSAACKPKANLHDAWVTASNGGDNALTIGNQGDSA